MKIVIFIVVSVIVRILNGATAGITGEEDWGRRIRDH